MTRPLSPLEIALAIRHKTPVAPLYLIHYLTQTCEAHCPICFVRDLHGIGPSATPLTPEEHVRVIRRMGRGVLNANLTGGEVFALPWLDDILDTYCTHTSVRSVLLTTSGEHRANTTDVLDRATLSFPDRTFVVSISMDGDPPTHEAIRPRPGLLDEAIATYHDLHALRRENLMVQACFTLQPLNVDRWRESLDHLALQRRVSNIVCSWARVPEDPARHARIEAYEACVRHLDHLRDSGVVVGYPATLVGALLNAKNQISRRILVDRFRGRRTPTPCLASRHFGVLDASGNVHPCEILRDPVGDIRDFGYDLGEAWRSQRNIMLHRGIVESGCSCTFECALTASVFFGLRHTPELAIRAALAVTARPDP